MHAAAERALAETRLQIGHYRDKPLDSANRVIALDCVIAEVGRDIEARFGCRVRLDLDRVDVTPRTAHELGRATCEALQNAARHGRSGEIRVRLDRRARVLRLLVEDDGSGIIDLTDGGARTFGLSSMRERAERLGGHCSIVSAPADGTRVAIEVPRR